MPFPSSGLPLFLFLGGLTMVLIAAGATVPILIKYGLHRSFGFVKGWSRLFSDEGQVDRKRAAKRILLGAAGLPLLFGGLLVGDHNRNVPCRSACRDAGYETGRLRRSPHAPGVAQDPYRCWCRDGAQAWADEPLPLTQ